ncbi:hypothetical protein M231_07511 [Tremella mesenterica]|uniref:Mediator of RNA polymerase II transcription subunit 21 n=1 Tax=Tremella mesenterica TaxID=5217 RepID=A0A4Q1BFR7_TREME|nr:hypothetical protein M231_07511 [Tremella mesenterica]
MLSEEISTDMDRITQLQDAILDLLTITHTSIEYITKRTQFEQTSLSIPQTLSTPLAAPREEYKESIQAFVADIVRRSQDIEKLIEALPKKDDSFARAARLQQLQDEMTIANAEYMKAVKQAEELLAELRSALAAALGNEGK